MLLWSELSVLFFCCIVVCFFLMLDLFVLHDNVEDVCHV